MACIQFTGNSDWIFLTKGKYSLMHLIHHALVKPYLPYMHVFIDSGNALLLDGAKWWPESLLTNWQLHPQQLISMKIWHNSNISILEMNLRFPSAHYFWPGLGVLRCDRKRSIMISCWKRQIAGITSKEAHLHRNWLSVSFLGKGQDQGGFLKQCLHLKGSIVNCHNWNVQSRHLMKMK